MDRSVRFPDRCLPTRPKTAALAAGRSRGAGQSGLDIPSPRSRTAPGLGMTFSLLVFLISERDPAKLSLDTSIEYKRIRFFILWLGRRSLEKAVGGTEFL